jgi:hypothetical protein
MVLQMEACKNVGILCQSRTSIWVVSQMGIQCWWCKAKLIVARVSYEKTKSRWLEWGTKQSYGSQ